MRQMINNALDEGRILLLGSQILIGFQWHALFEKQYRKLVFFKQSLGLVALFLILILFGLLLAPVCYHGIVSKGSDSPALLSFTTRMTEIALLPLAVVLGLDLFLSSGTLLSNSLAILIGVMGTLIALLFWFGFELFLTRRRCRGRTDAKQQEPTPLHVKIDQVLREARMVLPGAQALLGFQFIIFFSEVFQAIPRGLQLLHLGSLLLVCLTIILLVTPAAFHRIVERGENTERFHRVANVLVLLATIPLALASSLEFFIVAANVSGHNGLAAILSILLGIYFFGLWYGYTFYLRRREQNLGKPKGLAD